MSTTATMPAGGHSGQTERVEIIADGGTIARWQADALAALGPDFEVKFYNCTNMRPSRGDWRIGPITRSICCRCERA